MTAAEVRAAWQSAGRMLWCAAEGPDAICSNGDAAAHEGMIIVGFRGGELVRINRVLGPEFSAVLPAEFVDRQQPFGPPDRQAAGGEYSATWRSDSSERRVTCPEGARDASVCSISVVRTPE